ncbi:MAG: mannose-1-phosphate guanylyltransferase/mannose-6-phosphate isomerase [Gammaproteobacteria bacterium RIFCSPHIGHO2_12_FULL_38_14]|nr:MAG: mannose-1-phosphate guanylyltransferase/mannose-6-phosphate isomerase [Gammaproteobacteria bacterium RIFCSPHIGHO2_12_FULL_38_14]
MRSNVVPVVLAGGSGTRLWPLSRELHPKQFLKLISERSLFQETLLRAEQIAEHSPILVVCNREHYFICLDQLQEIAVKNVQFILEPVGKNTAPAITIAALVAKEMGEDLSILVMPSDHWIENAVHFKEAVKTAKEAAEKGFLVTFGVTPTSPKTGYGYIEMGESLSEGVFKIQHFIEKPPLATAEAFLQTKNYYWNSGIFYFQVKTILSEMMRLSPVIYQSAIATIHASEKHDQYVQLNTAVFHECPNNSIDYEVMEKTDRAVVVPLNTTWNDMGCWVSVAEANNSDEGGNVQSGNVLLQESENCYISTDGRFVAALGLKNQIVVSTSDAVLVADKRYSQSVKTIVNELKKKQAHLTKNHPLVHRPWGSYEVLAEGKNFQVKRIVVKSGARLSLQVHQHRAEHWVVVSGVADVVNDEKQFTLCANQSTYIPPKTKHRLGNSQSELLIIIEVQTGAHISEEDIVRLEDVYARV